MDGGRLKWEKEGRELTRDVPAIRADDLHGARAQRRAGPRVPRRGAGARRAEGPAGRRAQPRGVHRHAHAHARLSERRRAARRPHPGREERSLGARDQPGRRHVQDGGRADASSTSTTNKLERDKPTIAYCRIGERSSHTWFALQVPARLQERPQLRRLAGPSGATRSACRSRSRRAADMALPAKTAGRSSICSRRSTIPSDRTDLLLELTRISSARCRRRSRRVRSVAITWCRTASPRPTCGRCGSPTAR